MSRNDVLDLGTLIDSQHVGRSLDQAFYVSDQVFEADKAWMETEFFPIALSAELTNGVTHLVRELLGESLLIVRDEEGLVRGFYNVCRHRGSVICKSDGGGRRLTCPYHAWSYRLDGGLMAASAMPPDVDKSSLGLIPVAVREVEGLILASLRGDPRDLDGWASGNEAVMAFHGLSTARIAARRTYAIEANWKLVIENGLECYHCYPAHPEYCNVMEHAKALARIDPRAAEAWDRERTRWRAEESDPASPNAERYLPIGKGYLTQSKDGAPVAPLMGAQTRFNGGMTGIGRAPFLSGTLTNDHAVIFQILPRETQRTDLILTWLVDGEAREDEVDVERMIWLWDTTSSQDKRIIDDNAAGVRSRGYRPGPYSILEEGTERFVKFYLNQLSLRLAGDEVIASDAERDFSASGLSDGAPAHLE